MRRILGLLFTLAALAPSPALAADPPLIALVLDTSGSLTPADVGRRQDLAVGLLEALPAGSEIAIFNFDDESRLVLPRSADRARVREAITAQGRAGRFTALHDALYDATRYTSSVPGRRRAIVLVTDGKDENSALRLEDGAALARDGNVPVFAVGVGKVQEQVLRRIAKLTGGRYLGTVADGAAVASTVLEGLPASAPAAPAAPRSTGTTVEAASGALRSVQPAASGSASSVWSWLGPALGVLAGLGVALLFMWPRLAASPSPAAAAARADRPLPTEADDEPNTLVMRMEDLADLGQRTMVITMKPLLHVTKGPDSGRLFEVSLDAATSVGRAEGNDAALNDLTVSSQHCRIRPLPDAGYEVIDLQSTNGTFVNDRRVARQRLSAGDVIKVGETRISFRMDHMKGD